MTDGLDADAFSPTERLVLRALVAFDRRDLTPVRTPDVRRFCRSCDVDGDSVVLGTVSEADVVRSLYRLESADVVTEAAPESTSPVGKGRPAYDLAVDLETVVDAIASDPPHVTVEDDFWDR